MKNQKGVTLMSLVITIIVMVILLSVAGYYSIDSIKNSHIANREKEFVEVIEYVGVLKTYLLLEEFLLEEDTVVTNERLYVYENIIPGTQINKMLEVNLSALDPIYKYHFIDAEKLADKDFTNGKINVKDAKNSYIINFYTGTVIGLYDSKIEISGNVKGVTDILLEINEGI